MKTIWLCLFHFTALIILHTHGQISLDDKLEHQFAKYHVAKKAMIQRVVVEESVYNRTEWEALLAPDTDYEFTDDDISDLKARHAAVIEAALATAREESAIELDDYRDNDTWVSNFCLDFPREAILHIHPSGTRTLETVSKFLTLLNPIVNGTELEAAGNDGVLTSLYDSEIAFLDSIPTQRYMQFDDDDKLLIDNLLLLPADPCCHNFTRFQAVFEMSDVLLEQSYANETYAKRQTMIDYLEQCKELGLRYVEFTRSAVPPTLAKLEDRNDLFAEVESATDMMVQWNMAFVRTLDESFNAANAQTLIEVLKNNTLSHLVGIDLLANEENTDTLDVAQRIYVPMADSEDDLLQEMERTMHAGELGNVANMRDAMLMGTNRVGHGVLLQNDTVALEYAMRKELPLAMSIVSNWRLKVWPDLATHPFLKYLRLGLPVSLSTDDPGMFRTNIVNECEIVVSLTDIQYSELVQLSVNAIQQSFAPQELKDELMLQLGRELQTFEDYYAARNETKGVVETSQTGGDDDDDEEGSNAALIVGWVLFGVMVLVVVAMAVWYFFVASKGGGRGGGYQNPNKGGADTEVVALHMQNNQSDDTDKGDEAGTTAQSER